MVCNEREMRVVAWLCRTFRTMKPSDHECTCLVTSPRSSSWTKRSRHADTAATLVAAHPGGRYRVQGAPTHASPTAEHTSEARTLSTACPGGLAHEQRHVQHAGVGPRGTLGLQNSTDVRDSLAQLRLPSANSLAIALQCCRCGCGYRACEFPNQSHHVRHQADLPS